MKKKEKFSNFFINLNPIPIIEKGQLPNEHKPISAYAAKKQHEREYALLAAIGKTRQPLNLNEVKTKESKAEFTMTPEEIDDAIKFFEEVKREYREEYKREGEKAVNKLLEKYPQFGYVPQIQKVLKQKPFKKGKKHGNTRIGRTLVQALVNALREEKGYTEEEAFRYLSEEKIEIGYDQIRRLYKDAKKLNKPMIIPLTDGVASQLIPHCENEMIFLKQVVERIIKKDGKEAGKKVILDYIEATQKFLDNEETPQIFKDLTNDYRLIEKAKSLLAQME